MSFAVQLEDPGAQLLGISIVLSEKPCFQMETHGCWHCSPWRHKGFSFSRVFLYSLYIWGKLRHWAVSWSVRTSAAGQGATSFSSLVLTSVPLSLTGRCETAPLVSSWLRNRHCISTLLPYYFPAVASSWAVLLSAKFPQPFWPQLGLSSKTLLLQSKAPHCPDATHSSTHPQPIEKAVSRRLCASAKKDNY